MDSLLDEQRIRIDHLRNPRTAITGYIWFSLDACIQVCDEIDYLLSFVSENSWHRIFAALGHQITLAQINCTA
jgi:hypothetical protein